MNNAANVLNSIEQRMSNASPEDIAKLAQQVQNDPAIKSLIARGVIKYSDLLNADGTVNATRVKQISEELAKRGLAEKSCMSVSIGLAVERVLQPTVATYRDTLARSKMLRKGSQDDGGMEDLQGK